MMYNEHRFIERGTVHENQQGNAGASHIRGALVALQAVSHTLRYNSSGARGEVDGLGRDYYPLREWVRYRAAESDKAAEGSRAREPVRPPDTRASEKRAKTQGRHPDAARESSKEAKGFGEIIVLL